MPAATVRILGIDPGLRVTGFGVIEKSGASLSYIASGCVRSDGVELPDRLKMLSARSDRVHRPQRSR
jgi:crossover junction endodeoxyribonuclease RuvC